MNFFKIKIKVILSGFFMVYFLGILQFVKADLPNKDRRDAIPCVRKSFGEDFITKSFSANEDAAFLDGEYLGMICDNLTDKKFKEIIKNEAKVTYDYDGEELKTCLLKINKEDLFEKYRELGAPDELKNHSGTVADAQKQEHQSEASGMSMVTSGNLDLLSSPIYHFKKGICGSKLEEVEFEKVTGEEEKKETLSCLAQCTGKFMQRIQNMLTWGTEKAISLLNNDDEINALKDLQPISPNSKNPDKQEITEEKHHKKELDERITNLKITTSQITDLAKEFVKVYERSKKPKNIELIEGIGKGYLDTYSKSYQNVNYYKKDSNKKSKVFETLDNNLHAIFSIYKNCSKLGCGMILKSTPLFNLIEEGAKYQNPEANEVSNEPVKPTVGEMREVTVGKKREATVEEKRDFFKVLIGKPK